MTRHVRLLTVGLALAVAGALFGAIAGCVVGVSVTAAVLGAKAVGMAAPYQLGVAYGAPLGAVLAPLAAFTFLRQAPLWRLFLETTLGTILGALPMAFLFGSLVPVIAGGAVGFAAAAVLLAWRTRRRTAASAPRVEA